MKYVFQIIALRALGVNKNLNLNFSDKSPVRDNPALDEPFNVLAHRHILADNMEDAMKKLRRVTFPELENMIESYSFLGDKMSIIEYVNEEEVNDSLMIVIEPL